MRRRPEGSLPPRRVKRSGSFRYATTLTSKQKGEREGIASNKLRRKKKVKLSWAV